MLPQTPVQAEIIAAFFIACITRIPSCFLRCSNPKLLLSRNAGYTGDGATILFYLDDDGVQYSNISASISSSDAPSELCPTWDDLDNYSPGHGDIIAYPPHQLQARCHESPTLQQDNMCTCTNDSESGQSVITNFWSSNALDAQTSLPLARVLIDVFVLDNVNQTVPIGKLQ